MLMIGTQNIGGRLGKSLTEDRLKAGVANNKLVT